MAALTCPKCSTTWEVDQVRTGQHCPKCTSWVKAAPGVASSDPPPSEADSISDNGEGQEPEPAVPSGTATLPPVTPPDPLPATEPTPATPEPPPEPTPATEPPAAVPTLIRSDGQPTEEPVTVKPAAAPTPLVTKQTMPAGTELPRPKKPDVSHLPPRGIAGILQSKGIWTFHK